MWKLIKISQQTYFIYCNFNTRKDVTFILYDLKTAWSQMLTLQDVKQKVKFFNKRFDFNEDNIKEALSSGAIQSAVIEEEPNTSAMELDSCLLKLKYRVKNCLLNYEWNLKKQNLVEFQQTFVQPLLLALLDCHQQVDILADNIRKKDAELKQFRIEGVELNRKTLVTKPFDFDSFTKKYECCNKTANHFRELAKYVKENSQEESKTIHKELSANKIEQVKSERNVNNNQNQNAKMSPRQKKRKANELKMQHLEQHLKIRKLGLEYESSQSQTISSGNSQTIEDVKQSKQINTKQIALSKIENVPSPRRSSRSTPVKEKQVNMSNEDKIDSDDEVNLRALKERKVTRSSVNLAKEFSINSNKGQTKSNKKNNAEETTQKSGKIHFLHSSQTKSPERVFDFSEESDEDIPLSEQKKFLKNRSEDDMPLLKKKKLLTKERISVHNHCGSMSNISPVRDCTSVDSLVSMNPLPQSKSLSQSPTPVIVNEISLQLDNIRKELESLEAMRLADLKQRTCKV